MRKIRIRKEPKSRNITVVVPIDLDMFLKELSEKSSSSKSNVVRDILTSFKHYSNSLSFNDE